MPGDLDPRALSTLSYGVYIVTASWEGKLNGQISNTVFQVTSEPPRIAACVHKENLTHELIQKGRAFGVCVLDESAPMELIGLFGFRCGRECEKLSEVSYKTGRGGCPLVIDDVLAHLEAKVMGSCDVGTHTLFVGDVVAGEVLKEGKPLTYAFYLEHKKGRAPKTAPTYRPPDPTTEPRAG